MYLILGNKKVQQYGCLHISISRCDGTSLCVSSKAFLLYLVMTPVRFTRLVLIQRKKKHFASVTVGVLTVVNEDAEQQGLNAVHLQPISTAIILEGKRGDFFDIFSCPKLEHVPRVRDSILSETAVYLFICDDWIGTVLTGQLAPPLQAQAPPPLR
ncbi:hypothetical protein L3Q82_010080 [Scortum barcoo]|uniref:Uncharacterized protein n=1 Tax=Scortum barcoo TaxID=214431 RepID=A0ACB8WB73_9TELE|nr:hypothetical protein L3Q82_010080 [Scortum barcoo]